MNATATAAAQSGPQAGRVYLTFDDGPDAHFTPRVLDVLAEARVPATFFMIA
jgi:peptidoglycan/xylan/chitin deacetylase (PgdA/CDA1 family)